MLDANSRSTIHLHCGMHAEGKGKLRRIRERTRRVHGKRQAAGGSGSGKRSTWADVVNLPGVTLQESP